MHASHSGFRTDNKSINKSDMSAFYGATGIR